MPKLVVILDDTPDGQTLGMAMLQAIGTIVTSVQFTTVAELPLIATPDTVYCPLTLDLPPTFEFWGQSIGQTCQDIDNLRHLAATNTGVKVGEDGNMWLPVIWTAEDPIYGAVIGTTTPSQDPTLMHIDDVDRQPLHQFGYQLLTHLAAPPATYLIQFSQSGSEVVFDRLFPFPAAPALVSVNVQQPDLFACHWRCISKRSIVDVSANNFNEGNHHS